MRKGWIVLLTAVLVVAFAAPAMADLKVTGFYRAKSMLSSFFDGAGAPSIRIPAEEQTNAYAEQRAHLKFDVGSENVRAVFHFESDMVWGVGPTTAARNSGGQLSADSVQLETKNLYVWFKIPDTSIQAKVGMQGVNDHYAGIFSNGADMTGVFFNGQLEPVKWTLGWAKLYENPNATVAEAATLKSGGFGASDDVDLYIASVAFAPAKDMALGLNFYYLQDDSGKPNLAAGSFLDPVQGLEGPNALNGFKVRVYTPGVNFGMNLGPVKLSTFAFYQFGDAKSTVAGVPDIDLSSFVVDVRGDMKLGPGSAYLEGLYVSGSDGPAVGADLTEYEAPITLGDYQTAAGGTGGNAGFGRTHMYFLFGYDSQNVSQCLIGCSGGELGDSLGNSGRGLWHVATGYSMKFTDKLKGEANLGYLSAGNLWVTDTAVGRDKDMGTEINVRADYEVQKGLTFSLAAAYMKLGDFIVNLNDDGTRAVVQFEDSYYMGFARLNYSF